MSHFKGTATAISTLTLLISGCGVKEGAEFYTLQKQHSQLVDVVSNLQVQVSELIVEDNRLRSELASNSQAVSLAIQAERQYTLVPAKLQQTTSTNSEAGQTVEGK